LVDILPASGDLSGVSFHLSQPNELQREQRLTNLIQPIEGRYDAMVVDMPPARETITINGLVAASRYLVPIAAGGWDLDGLEKMLQECGRISRVFHNSSAVTRIVLSRQNRSKVAKEIDKTLRASMPQLVCKTGIPEAVKVPEALFQRKTVWEHAPDHAVTLAFTTLINEVLSYEQKQTSAA
jgi:chromosome partitioning protein